LRDATDNDAAVKILHVDSARGWRGGQNQVLLTAQGMAGRGHSVTVACQRGGVLEERARAAGLDVRAQRFHGDLSPAAVLGLRRLLRRERFDAVQLHDPHALACGVLASRGTGVPLVATRRVDFALRGRWSRWKYTSAARVVAVSDAIRSVLARGGLDAGRLRVVYEGVPDRPAAPGGREALVALGIPRNAPVIGNVAALTGHKDHATLLKAARLVLERAPEARFVVVGEGELRAQVEALHRELGLGERCVLAGFRTDLDRLLPAFSIFCLTSHMEGLGTSLLDAMAFARPVVATRAGGIPEAVEDGVTGALVPVRDPPALAAALLELLKDETRRRALGQAGRRRYEEHFTAERMVENTLSVYAELSS
jgi:glycosyltransferase involved in cell wall biosynthesis